MEDPQIYGADMVEKLTAIPALAAAAAYYFNGDFNPAPRQTLVGDAELESDQKLQLTLYLNIATISLLIGYALIQMFRGEQDSEINTTLRRLSTLLLAFSGYLSALMNNTLAVMGLFLVGLIVLVNIFHEPKLNATESEDSESSTSFAVVADLLPAEEPLLWLV